MSVLRYKRRIHFSGIGGVGMSALAEILHAHGFDVTGSDHLKSSVTRRLESLGIRVQYDHTPSLMKDADMLVYSSAVKEHNPEREYALKTGIPAHKRSRIAGELMQCRFSICVAGTHGKTTTSSMIGKILVDVQRDPTLIIGGFPLQGDSNARTGAGPLLVAEADEYDCSFLDMIPAMAVITNIEAEHLECYAGLEEIKDAFTLFAGKVPFYGAVIACVDDPNVKDILSRLDRTVITYGFEEGADYRAIKKTEGHEKIHAIECRGEHLGTLQLSVPGEHNVYNALAALAVAMEMDISFSDAQKSLGDFTGVKRRFETVGKERGVTVIDDYAHHPREVRATIEAAKEKGFNNIIAVFQPHLYTRTRDFMGEFADALLECSVVIVTEIYKAREEPIAGVSAEKIVETLCSRGHSDVVFVPVKEAAVQEVIKKARDGDVVILMGAGNINALAPDIIKELSHA
ncbi:MAG: UDP-N-acetylmuramate--L-alanine ligase [Chitinivibrionales bacterium]|nr:UDP-N-acetylmuramate--L-alanine ligase [Chitinivibrionales bacterium]